MNSWIEVGVGILAEDRPEGQRVLIARRLQGGVLGGYWEFPGGKLEAEESLEQCVAREFAEELGLEVVVGTKLVVVEHDYPHGRVRLSAYMCRRRGGEPRALQVAEHRWVSAGELGTYRFPPANGQVISHLLGWLAAGGEGGEGAAEGS
jgi:mutator protein MutT